jgi:glycogen debranching enzyme
MTKKHRQGKPRWEQAPEAYGLIEDISNTLVCREQDKFFVTDRDGDMPAGNRSGLGFYVRDTRHLNVCSLLLNGAKPLVLLSGAESGFSQEQVLGNHRSTYDGRPVPRATIELLRQRVLTDDLAERLVITNHNHFDVGLTITYHFGADFADIFEVQGHQRQHAGTLMEPRAAGNSIQWRYLGADGVWRETLILFQDTPTILTAEEATFEVQLNPGQSRELRLHVTTGSNTPTESGSPFVATREDYARWRSEFTNVFSDNELFNEVIRRSIDDLRTLWTRAGDSGGYFAAGVPWYSTLFGRDSLITALQVLPLKHDAARKCLEILARYQSKSFDRYREEQPGKILHEMRESELAVIRELPYEQYYGSVDSTPLFLLVAAEFYRWSGDLETMRNLLPAIRDAIRWIREFGTKPGDQYLRYETGGSTGLRNQGWKDSSDSIMHTDGSLCEGSVALVEVQGYVFAAYQRLAPILDLLDEESLAEELRQEAAALREAFLRDFWLPDLGRVAMALDGDNRPSEVVSSNAGQVLCSGILDPKRAEAVRAALFQNDMFSGWGIRTLSSDSASYFPLGYHVGTIWPHDNAMIGLGLKRYGFDAEAEELLTALFDAAQHFPARRLPELFGGQPRSVYMPPVPYPVACRPQAWAAGTLLQLLHTTLGLHADAQNRRLYVIRPRLPFWLDRVHVNELCLGDGVVDLHFSRQDGKTIVKSEARGVEVIETDDVRAFSL